MSDHLNTHTPVPPSTKCSERTRARELVRRIEMCHSDVTTVELSEHRGERTELDDAAMRAPPIFIGDVEKLHDEVSAWFIGFNGTQRGVDWQMKVFDARCKLKSVYPKMYEVTDH